MTKSELKMPKDFACGVIVVRKEESRTLFLVVKSAKGNWGFPKGHKDPGENDKETAIRELREETGLEKIDVTDKTFTCNYIFRKDGVDYDKDVAFFLGFTDVEKIVIPEEFTHEISATQWADYEEVKNLFSSSFNNNALIGVITEANEYLTKKA